MKPILAKTMFVHLPMLRILVFVAYPRQKFFFFKNKIAEGQWSYKLAI